MNKMFMGLIFVLIGITFLMLSLTVSMPTLLWAVSLGTSIILNIAGTAILMEYIKTIKKSF
ncbi:hypothetical protein [Bacillus sp. MUM 13]|uniref:hypothetical protein n=1 Tax=Bacillus sp. MUM 13 TaxID=1678001 RepID=UPI0008F566A1|nr:hypothetical protein [Bacillus sp. MUM 13]OIK11666.1 hypothetical protein BIV59_11555 [Bacillus sp. MUM 13]